MSTTYRTAYRLAIFGLAFSTLVGCESSKKQTDTKTVSPPPVTEKVLKAGQNSDIFDPARVLTIEIEMPAKDWDVLRKTGHDASVSFTRCPGVPKKIYSYQRAKVTIDGVTLEGVGVRKKGYLGSLSVLRPSLKLKFDEFVEGQKYQGVRRMTLNNNKQDRALMRTCLIYKVFSDAKLPAPRCNFARVKVNGTDFGIYSNVEPIKKPFLRRNFGEADGNLYEGLLADFKTDWVDNFEKKIIAKKAEPDQLAKLSAALEQPDDKLVAAVSSLIDYDEFLSFWALETLVGHWDGYTNNRNNFYVYVVSKSGRLHFIPWGTDMGFTYNDPFHKGERPLAVSAEAKLASRLYSNAKVRADYIARMNKLLDTIWDEKALLAEVDRIEKMLGGLTHDDDVAEIKLFITERKQKLAKELSAGGIDWKVPGRTKPCSDEGGEISGKFETIFDNLEAKDLLTKGTASLHFSLDGKPIKCSLVGAVAGRDVKSADVPAVRLLGVAGERIFVVQLLFEEPLFKAGETQPFHGFATWGLVLEVIEVTNIRFIGLLGSGHISLEQAGVKKGSSIKGSFSGKIYLFPHDKSTK
jgi:spore coat protein CotH